MISINFMIDFFFKIFDNQSSAFCILYLIKSLINKFSINFKF